HGQDRRRRPAPRRLLPESDQFGTRTAPRSSSCELPIERLEELSDLSTHMFNVLEHHLLRDCGDQLHGSIDVFLARRMNPGPFAELPAFEACLRSPLRRDEPWL